MSDSVQPHRRQPTRLPRPWDSPGKNTGVGCHFLLQCMKVKGESEDAQSCPTLSDPTDCSPPDSSVHGIFPGKSTGVGCHCLLQQKVYMANKHTKRCFTLHIIGKTQIKTMRYLYMAIRMAKSWNIYYTKCCQGCRAIGILINCSWECNMYSYHGRQFWQFLTKLNILLP